MLIPIQFGTASIKHRFDKLCLDVDEVVAQLGSNLGRVGPSLVRIRPKLDRCRTYFERLWRTSAECALTWPISY